MWIELDLITPQKKENEEEFCVIMHGQNTFEDIYVQDEPRINISRNKVTKVWSFAPKDHPFIYDNFPQKDIKILEEAYKRYHHYLKDMARQVGLNEEQEK